MISGVGGAQLRQMGFAGGRSVVGGAFNESLGSRKGRIGCIFVPEKGYFRPANSRTAAPRLNFQATVSQEVIRADRERD